MKKNLLIEFNYIQVLIYLKQFNRKKLLYLLTHPVKDQFHVPCRVFLYIPHTAGSIIYATSGYIQLSFNM